MPAIIGELLDEVFIRLPQFIFRHVRDRERERREVFYQVAQRGIRKPLFVGPLRIPKNTKQLRGK